MSRAAEEAFNYALGAALRSITLRWRADANSILVEQTHVLDSAHLRPDLLIHDAWSPPVVVECSFHQRDAETDAANRLVHTVRRGGKPVKTAFAVHIPALFRRTSPEGMEQALGAGHEISYALYQRSRLNQDRRWPADGFIKGTVQDLAALLPAAARHKEQIDEVARAVATLLENAAAELSRSLPDHVQKGFARQVYQRSPLASLRTIMVLWLDAELARSMLFKHTVPGTQPKEDANSPQIAPLDRHRTWRAILAQNRRPIFDPAVATLYQACDSDSEATARALDWIDKAREQIEIANLGPHINVGAELFPLLSEDRKEAAAYYTQPATAELLAHLTVGFGDLAPAEWSDARLFARRRLGDLACGTGTLLRAGYRRVLSFHERGGTAESCAEFHRVAMESGLVGADVSPIAAHLTSSSLAALGSGAPYTDSQIGWVDIGGAEGRTGSLEYFDVDAMRDLFGSAGGVSSGMRSASPSLVGVADYSLDWILMNPPYSRTRGGQSAFDVAGLSDGERKACQKRWKRLVRQEPCSNQAGMAASFVALARRKVKLGGRIGSVLPLTAALADSWTVTRQMIERDFKELIAVAVVAGKALGKDALSADTHMEEMLLIGTRSRARRSNGQPGRTTMHCVTLYQAPSRMGEAGEIARAITSARRACASGAEPIKVGNDDVGLVCAFDTVGSGSPWSAVGVLRPDLVNAALQLEQGILAFDAFESPLGVPITSLGAQFSIGPTHHLIGHLAEASFKCGAFAMHPVRGALDTVGPDRALWAAKKADQRTLLVSPTHKGSAPEGIGSDQTRQAMRQRRSTVFYARNVRWTSQALLVASTAQPVMGGSAWLSLSHCDERIRKALALWSNSTLGLLVHWTKGQRTQTGRSRTQVGALTKLPCPHLDQLSRESLDGAAVAFDRLKGRALLPACQAHADDVRKSIDAAVLKVFGLHGEGAAQTVDALRWLWCNEPSVHGGNRAAMRLRKQQPGP